MSARRGAVLIVVAGACALLATLAIAFLVRMRVDVAETAQVQREAQARIMLLAGCGYVLEASRLGYDTDPWLPDPAPHEEAYGWIDVRDGSVGPNDRAGRPLWRAGAWPAVGTTAICPMERWRRPPWAIRQTVVYNPIDLDQSDADWGFPYLKNPDPQPAVDNGWPSAVSDARFREWAAGDPRPVAQCVGLAWFRVHRESAATFVLTCGAGATRGYQDWAEVARLHAEDLFGGDRQLFDELLAQETRRWYRVAWNAAVAPSDYHFYDNELHDSHVVDQYYFHPMNSSQTSPSRTHRSNIRIPNLVGTIRWVQRLWTPPAQW